MSDPDSFPTLQSIVLHEVQNDVALVRNSATEALLWLRRGLRFLKEFLSEVNAGQQDIQGALSKHVDTKTSPVSLDKHQALCGFLRADNAYGKTLRQYHGWVVRGVFAVGVSLSHLTTFALQHCGNDSFCPLWLCFPSWPWEQLHPIKVSAPPWCRERAMSWREASPEGCTGIWGPTCPPWSSSWPSWTSCTKSTTWSQTKWCEDVKIEGLASGRGWLWGQNSNWLLLPGAIEGILCTKECDCVLCHFQGLVKTYASLKEDFWSTFKSPQRCSRPGEVSLLQCRLKQQIYCEIWFCGICCHSSLYFMRLQRNIYSGLFTSINETGC